MRPHRTRPLRIVVVDDEELRLEMIEMMISRYFEGPEPSDYLTLSLADPQTSRTIASEGLTRCKLISKDGAPEQRMRLVRMTRLLSADAKFIT